MENWIIWHPCFHLSKIQCQNWTEYPFSDWLWLFSGPKLTSKVDILVKNIYQEIHQSILKTQAVSTNRDSPRPVFKRDFQTFQLSFNLQCKFSCLGLLFLREFRLQVPFILLQALFMDGPLRAIHNCCLSRGGGRGSKIIDFEMTQFMDGI